MENIRNKDYATFLEDVLRQMVKMPVEGICVLLKLNDGSTALDLYNINAMDMITFSNALQQNAIQAALGKNKIQPYDTGDSLE